MWSFYCAGTLDASVVMGIFVASLRSVGCAVTLAAAGLWLARNGLMSPSLSKGLSQLSVKLAIPALLFSSMVPGISFELLAYAWPLLLLPAVYLLIGTLIGWLMLVLVQPPDDFRLGTVLACAFGNTTGIPVVILSVLQQSLSRSVFADIADPLLFLSLALVTLPLLQYLVGVALLRDRSGGVSPGGSAGAALCMRLCGTPCGGLGRLCCRNCGGGDLCCGLCAASGGEEELDAEVRHILPAYNVFEAARAAEEAREVGLGRPIRRNKGEESTSYISMMSQGEDEVVPWNEPMTPPESVSERLFAAAGTSASPQRSVASQGRHVAVSVCRSLIKLLRRVFVPQVVGIVGGGLVGLYGRQLVLPPETAPLGWLYLGIGKLGAAAVPINLILLGAALSRTPAKGQLPPLTAAGIAIGRMVFMPLCGLGVAKLLSTMQRLHYLVEVPSMVADPFWLVSLILTTTPTANNIVVMCDLAGENRRAMSASIFYQYMLAPFVLPGVLTLFISFICRTRSEE